MIEDNYNVSDKIQENTEGKSIGILMGGTDCDGYSWRDNTIIEASVPKFNEWINDWSHGLDGPADYLIVTPSEVHTQRRKRNENMDTY